MKLPKLQWDFVWRQILFGLGVLFLALFAYTMWQRNGEPFLLIIAAALCFIASRLSDITKFKVSPGSLEADLQETLVEAKATVAQLQLLAGEQVKVALHLMQSEGRWGGGSSDGKAIIREQLLTMLRKLGLSQDAINSIVEVEHPFLLFDYAIAGTGNLQPNDDQRERWNAFAAKHEGIGNQASPSELRAFLAEIEMLSPEVEERLQRYEYVVEHKTHPPKLAG